MAKKNAPESSIDQEKKRLANEKKQLKQDQKKQKQEAKKRAKDIAKQESALDDGSEGGGISTFLITVIIIVIWLAILILLIKLDVGGFGSNVLKPILKDVPVVNLILPADETTETDNGDEYYGYTSLRDAVDQIKLLEMQLEQAQSLNKSDAEKIEELTAEVQRLRAYEENQVEFARIKQAFFEEVVYAENGPGAEAYAKFYEAMDPTTAEYMYKQVVIQQAKDAELEAYASAYASMKPKAAAAIFESMTDDLELVAKILGQMGATDRGAILGAMDETVAAQITKIMDPDS